MDRRNLIAIMTPAAIVFGLVGLPDKAVGQSCGSAPPDGFALTDGEARFREATTLFGSTSTSLP